MYESPQTMAARAAAILIDSRNRGEASPGAVEQLNDYIHQLATRADELKAQLREATNKLNAAGACKVWTDTLGRKFVFVDELWHALAPEYHPRPVPIRLDGGEA